MKISYQVMQDFYRVRRRAKFVGAGYKVSECFAHRMNFSEKLLVKAGPSVSYARMSPHALMTWMHSTLPGKEALKMVVSGTNRIRFSTLNLRIGMEGRERREYRDETRERRF